MRQSIDDQVRAFYLEQEMPQDRVEQILQRTAELRRARQRRWLALAATIVLVVAGGLWLRHWTATEALADRVVAEVAMNHRKDLGVEVSAADYDQLQPALDKLPFAILPPATERAEGYRLLGGRYCSIQAQLAAQLKIRDPQTGRTATLYVTELSPQLQSLPGKQRTADEVTVDIWAQDGLLYALAQGEGT
ncbi:MAG: hypothetical protein AAGD01_02240 [Acidobacteriota bacterium]